jgi:glycerophosphoryl diester phosphodiesterase
MKQLFLNTQTLCIAHRGAASLAPENSLTAARKALALGADMWELDVSVTADGQLVVLHDDSLTRTSNAPTRFSERAPWLVSSFTLAEVQQLDTGSWFVANDPFGTIAAGLVSLVEQANFIGEIIPSLHEALLFTRNHNWRANIEMKALLPAQENFPVVEAVVGLIEELGMIDRVLLSSFVHPYLRRARAINPAIAIAALVDEGETWPVELFFEALHPYYADVTPEKVAPLRQAGIAVNPWTVNDPADMQRLIRAGVTGLITDFPQRVIEGQGNR